MADSATSKVVPKEPTALQSFIAGGVGGILVVVIGQPFDTVKVSSVLCAWYFKGRMLVGLNCVPLSSCAKSLHYKL